VVPERPLPICHPELLERDDYADLITGQDPDALAGILRELGVAVVMAGCETGVELADALAARLGLAGNDPATSRRRRDKGLMSAALASAGLAHTRTARAGTLEQAQAAARELGGPVVLKPPASTGNDSVAVCRSAAEVTAAWDAAAGALSRMGEPNTELLVQEFLQGQPFTVNTVSCQASRQTFHHVCEVWRDSRREAPGGRAIYDRTDLLPADVPFAVRAGAYVRQALDALGVTTGPAHTEIMLTSRGFVLIETGARLAGMAAPYVMERAIGESQCSLAVEAAMDPAGFTGRHVGRRYRRPRAVAQLDLIAPRPATLDAGAVGEILALPTVASASGNLRPGARVDRTVDLFTSPGHLFHVGARADVDRDIAAVRAIEARRLYR
jgi:biotin carboxylase